MMARHAVPIFHPGHSLFFQKGEAARYRIPNRSIVDWRWIIGPDRSADGTEAKQGRKDHAGHRLPHSFDGGASKSKNGAAFRARKAFSPTRCAGVKSQDFGRLRTMRSIVGR